MDYKWMATHPYTDKARQALKQLNPVLTDTMLVTAQHKLIDMLKSGPKRIEFMSQEQAKQELMVYPVLRMITAQMNYSFSRKVAKCLAQLWTDELKQEGNVFNAGDITGVALKTDYTMHFVDYLCDMPKDHKLVNACLQKAMVKLTERDAWDVIRTHLSNTFFDTLPRKKNEKAKKAAQYIIAKLPVPKNTGYVRKDIAPCIQELINALNKGENVQHIGRWVAAVYLARIGWTEDQIIALFSKTPNFNHKIAQYHVHYIIQKKYVVPSCETIKSYGLCTNECGTKSPLSKRARVMKK